MTDKLRGKNDLILYLGIATKTFKIIPLFEGVLFSPA